LNTRFRKVRAVDLSVGDLVLKGIDMMDRRNKKEARVEGFLDLEEYQVAADAYNMLPKLLDFVKRAAEETQGKRWNYKRDGQLMPNLIDEDAKALLEEFSERQACARVPVGD